MLLLGRGDGVSAVAFLRFIARRGLPVLLMLVGIVGSVIWLLGSRNPYTPAGDVGYLTEGAVFGQSRFYGVLLSRIRQYADASPFVISSVVVGTKRHGNRDRTEGADEARSDRGAEADGEFPEPHHHLHTGRADGGSAHGNVSGIERPATGGSSMTTTNSTRQTG